MRLQGKKPREKREWIVSIKGCKDRIRRFLPGSLLFQSLRIGVVFFLIIFVLFNLLPKSASIVFEQSARIIRVENCILETINWQNGVMRFQNFTDLIIQPEYGTVFNVDGHEFNEGYKIIIRSLSDLGRCDIGRASDTVMYSVFATQPVPPALLLSFNDIELSNEGIKEKLGSQSIEFRAKEAVIIEKMGNYHLQGEATLEIFPQHAVIEIYDHNSSSDTAPLAVFGDEKNYSIYMNGIGGATIGSNGATVKIFQSEKTAAVISIIERLSSTGDGKVVFTYDEKTEVNTVNQPVELSSKKSEINAFVEQSDEKGFSIKADGTVNEAIVSEFSLFPNIYSLLRKEVLLPTSLVALLGGAITLISTKKQKNN